MRPALIVALVLAPFASARAQSAVPIPAALDPANIDRKYGACEDFFMFANNGWIANNPIPDVAESPMVLSVNSPSRVLFFGLCRV